MPDQENALSRRSFLRLGLVGAFGVATAFLDGCAGAEDDDEEDDDED